MAAIDLRAVSSGGWPYTATSAVTWQEFLLPARVKFSVSNEDANATIYVATDGGGLPSAPEVPVDGGAVGTHRIPVAPGAMLEVRLAAPGAIGQSTSVFIAGSIAGPYTVLIEAD